MMRDHFEFDLESDKRLPHELGGYSPGRQAPVLAASWLVARLQHLVTMPLEEFFLQHHEETNLHLVAQRQDADTGAPSMTLLVLSFAAEGRVSCLVRGSSLPEINTALKSFVDLLLDEPARVGQAVLVLPSGERFGSDGTWGAAPEPEIDPADWLEAAMDGTLDAPPLEGEEALCPKTPLELAREASDSSRQVQAEELELLAAVRLPGARAWLYTAPRDQHLVVLAPAKGEVQVMVYG